MSTALPESDGPSGGSGLAGSNPRAFLCPYCAQWCPEDKRSREHPLSETLGAIWWRSSTCQSCNSELGDSVDQQFADKLWIHEARHRYRVPDRRGRLPGPPEVAGELDDGTPVRVVFNNGGVDVKLVPVKEELDDRTVRFGVDAAEADPYEILEKQRRRFEARIGRSVEDFTTSSRLYEQPQVNGRWVEDTFLWPQIGAKVALSVGQELLGDDWVLGDHASWLRDVLWGREASPPADFLPLLPADGSIPDGLKSLLQPPEHALIAKNSRHGVVLLMILFGQMAYTVPLGKGTSAVEEIVWHMDPVKRTLERTSWGNFVHRLILRLAAGSGSP